MVRAVIACLVVTVTSMACAYDPGTFEGDGVVTDRGFWSYRPRYSIELRPSASLAVPDRHQYRFRGLPSESLSVLLVVQDVSMQDHERLKQLTTTVELALADSTGKVACHVAGPLTNWKLMWTTGRGGAYWRRECVDLQLQPREWHTLVVVVTNVETGLPPLRIVPLLSGGGWDSP